MTATTRATLLVTGWVLLASALAATWWLSGGVGRGDVAKQRTALAEEPAAEGAAWKPAGGLVEEALLATAADERRVLPPKPHVAAVAPSVPPGRLFIKLEDGAGNSIPSATVRVHRKRWAESFRRTEPDSLLDAQQETMVPAAASLELDEQGEGRIELSSGTWGLWIDGSTLPAGYAAPREQARSRPLDVRRPEEGWLVELGAGKEASVTLRCIRLATLAGAVAQSEVLEMSELNVSLEAKERTDHPGYNATTEDEGNFRFTHVDPGRYSLSVTGLDADGESKRSEAVHFALREGQHYDVGCLRFGDEGARIHGRLVDARGGPYPDFDVVVYPPDELRGDSVAVARTDAEGRFTLRSVPPGRWKLVSTEGPGVLAGWMEAITIDVASDDLELAPIVLERSTPFVLAMTFRVASRRDESELGIDVQHVVGGETLSPSRAVRLRTQEEDVAPVVYPREIRYAWRTLESAGEVNLKVELRDRAWTETVMAQPNVTREVLLDLDLELEAER